MEHEPLIFRFFVLRCKMLRMMQDITLTIDETLVEQARRRAAAENRTLDELFREWLQQYVAHSPSVDEYEALMVRLDYVQAGRTFSREEMNERR